MIPWIQIYSNLVTHPKTARLAKELKLQSSFTSPAVTAAGILVAIWTWAIQNAPDGDLSDVPNETIADACRWKKDATELVDALIASEYLDYDGATLLLHDWDDYTLQIQDLFEDAKQKHRERQRRYRERQKSVTDDDT